jgi:hypothetical protein
VHKHVTSGVGSIPDEGGWEHVVSFARTLSVGLHVKRKHGKARLYESHTEEAMRSSPRSVRIAWFEPARLRVVKAMEEHHKRIRSGRALGDSQESRYAPLVASDHELFLLPYVCLDAPDDSCVEIIAIVVE